MKRHDLIGNYMQSIPYQICWRGMESWSRWCHTFPLESSCKYILHGPFKLAVTPYHIGSPKIVGNHLVLACQCLLFASRPMMIGGSLFRLKLLLVQDVIITTQMCNTFGLRKKIKYSYFLCFSWFCTTKLVSFGRADSGHSVVVIT